MALRLRLAAVAMLFAMPALAQQDDPDFVPIAREWEAVALSMQHLQDKILAYRTTRNAEREKLAKAEQRTKDLLDYAALCGDKPGCWAPP